MTSDPTTAPRRYAKRSLDERRAERRARLIEIAVQTFGNEGFRAVPIERLCSLAGISTRNFYEEFKTREELLVHLHDDLNERALHAVVASLADVAPDDVPGRVRAAVEAYFRVMTADRRWARVVVIDSVGASPTAEQHRREAITRFVDLIALEAGRLADAGLVERHDYTLTAVAIGGALERLVSTWTAGLDWDAPLPLILDEAERLILRLMPPMQSA